MLKVGLTGGIGSGKTTVANYFASLGASIIDADVIVHYLLEHNKTVFAKIFEHFGSQVLTTDSTINRKYLKQVIFSDKDERKWLEDLLHPLVYQEIEQQLCSIKVPCPYCIIVIPLLLETGGHTVVDRVLVVNTDVDKQIQRTMLRDNICASEVSAVIESQANNIWRLSHANDIIDNNGSLENMQKQVLSLHEFYIKLSRES